MTTTPKVSAVNSILFARRRYVGYFLLISLAWFQVAFASHQVEHVSGDLLDVCTVCKQLERHDAAVAQQPAETASAAPSPVPVAKPASPDPARILRSYESRAPPSA